VRANAFVLLRHGQASKRTPEELKVRLIEYLATSQSPSDRLSIVPFLVEQMKHEKQDKARACAILALDILFARPSFDHKWRTYIVLNKLFVLHLDRHGECPPEKFTAAHDLATDLWSGNSLVSPLGVLSKAALGTDHQPLPTTATLHNTSV
jgi:hypothetical protein